MSKQELTTLLDLANLSEGRAQDMAVDLFIKALKRIDWNLIDPFDVARQSLDDARVIACQAYKAILSEASAQLVKVTELTQENAQLKQLAEETTRLQTPEGLFEEVLDRVEAFNSMEEIIIMLPRYKALFERLNRLGEKFQRPGLSSLSELYEKMQTTADKFATSEFFVSSDTENLFP